MSISKGYDDETLQKVQNVQKLILKDFIDFCNKHNLNYFMVYGSALGTVRHKGTIPWDDDIDVGMMREDYDRFIELFNQYGIEELELLNTFINKNYITRVTHLQKKNTTFVSEFSKDLKCHLGINIDIFPFDVVSDNKDIRIKQFKKTYFYGKLLFLVGTGNPNIPNKGIIGNVYKLLCKFVHLMLTLFKVDSQKIYGKFVKYCILSNNENSDKYCCYGDYSYERDILEKEDIYPLVLGDYDGLKVNLPNNVDKHLKSCYGDNYMQIPPPEQQINHYPFKIDFEK